MAKNKLLSSDLYTRNQVIKHLVENVRDKKSLKVLDVGGYNGELNTFLKASDKVVVLDVFDINEKNYVKGDARNIQFQSSSFDIVTCSDTMEHIDPKDRIKVYEELLRVSSDYVIIGAPYGEKTVSQAEESANNFYKQLTKKSHPWLEEHKSYGLPSKVELEDFLEKSKLSFYKIESNNVFNWLLLIMLNFYSEVYDDVTVHAIHRFYNLNHLKLDDLTPPCYRTTYLISKVKTLEVEKLDQIKKENQRNLAIYADWVKEIISQISNKEQEKRNLAKELELNKQKLASLTSKYEEIVNSRSWKLLTKVKKFKRGLPIVHDV